MGAGDGANTPAAEATTVDAPPVAPTTAAAGGAEGDGASDKEKEDEPPARTAEQVLEDERKAADERYKTTVPEKALNGLVLFERFAKAPVLRRTSACAPKVR